MDEWILLGLLLALVVLLGPILGITALFKASRLRQQLERLENKLEQLKTQQADRPAAATATTHAYAASEPTPTPTPTFDFRETAEPAEAADRRTAPSEPVPTPTTSAAPAPPPLPDWDRVLSANRAPLGDTPAEPASPRLPDAPSAVEIGIARVKQWFASGNVPVKIGMLVLLVGVASLLRYASNQGWLHVPVELKLAGISATAIAALAFAWRKRESHRSFALALQGGAIGVLLLVAFAAFKTYHLIGAGSAFGFSVLLIAGLAVMAVLQDSRTLAILGTLAGFMAPIWLSDGSGNHVALFSYYTVLNAGILAMAWMRPWRILNLLGFGFTWGIATAWGVLDYAPEKFASTEPFLLLFFAFYLALPLLYARKATTPGGARIDGCLLFGTPLIAFSLQAGLLQGERMPLALCALGLAALYAVLARLLIGRERMQLLAQGFAILAVGFATLSIPLALSARATASVFALEGAGLVWLGMQQQRRLARWTGVALQLAAAYALGIGATGLATPDAIAVANPGFMGALLIALAGFMTAWLYRKAGSMAVAGVFYGWGLLWWLGDGLGEIARFAPHENTLHLDLLLFGISAWLAAEFHRRDPARGPAWTTLGGLLLALPLAFAQTVAQDQPFAHAGIWTWPVFAVLALRSLVCLRASGSAAAGWAQLVWWMLWPTVLSLLAWHVGDVYALADGWVWMLLALPWLALAATALLRWDWLTPPLGALFNDKRLPLQVLASVALILWWGLALTDPGNSAPLPWLPLLNPLDLAQAALLILLAQTLRDHGLPASSPWRLAVLLAALLLVSVMTLRGVHHWGGKAWDVDLLPSMQAQTSLAVVWSLLGVIGWVLGSRRGQWGLWLSGAILMGIVLLKLLLVDRTNLGDLLGIGAFIAYGLLCTLVGWMAPVPPRRTLPPPTPAAADGVEA